MNQTGGKQQQFNAEVQPFKQVGIDAETQTNTLLELAQEMQTEQTALLEATQTRTGEKTGIGT